MSTSAHSLALIGGKLVWSFVLNRNGAIAWIATGGGFRGQGPDTVEVHRVTSTDPTRSEILDSASRMSRSLWNFVAAVPV